MEATIGCLLGKDVDGVHHPGVTPWPTREEGGGARVSWLPQRTLEKMQLGEFMAAGVLPYCEQGGRIAFFLGKELSKGRTLTGKHKYVWSDFGGKREDAAESAQRTAAREFSEETLGLWGGMGPLPERIERSFTSVLALCEEAVTHGGASAQAVARSFVIKNGLYITFVLPLSYIDALLFQLARDENDKQLTDARDSGMTCRAAEKRDWTWVDAGVLADSMLQGQCRTKDQEGQTLHLLPRLAVSLRTNLRFMLSHMRSAQPRPDALLPRMLEVGEEETACLHLFGVCKQVVAADVQSVLERVCARVRPVPHGDQHRDCAPGHAGGQVRKVTLYFDRLGSRNSFVLFDCTESAVLVKQRVVEAFDGAGAATGDGCLDAEEDRQVRRLWEVSGGGQRATGEAAGAPAKQADGDAASRASAAMDTAPSDKVQFAWFTHGQGGQGEADAWMRRSRARKTESKHDRQRLKRRVKLGIAQATAPWARGRESTQRVDSCWVHATDAGAGAL